MLPISSTDRIAREEGAKTAQVFKVKTTGSPSPEAARWRNGPPIVVVKHAGLWMRKTSKREPATQVRILAGLLSSRLLSDFLPPDLVDEENARDYWKVPLNCIGVPNDKATVPV